MKTKQKLNVKKRLIVLFSILFLILLATALSAKTTYWIGDGVNLSIDPDNALFVDTTNNRVGIGTTSPSQALEIESNNSIKIGPMYLSANTGSNEIVNFATYTWYDGSSWHFPEGKPGALIQMDDNRTSFWRHDGAGSWTNTMQLSDNGNVGIGENSPGAKLHVRYPGATTPTGPSGTWAARVDMNQDTAAYNGLSVATRWGAAASKVFEVASYWSGSSEVYTPIMTVTGDRHVGIGDSTPTEATLTVGGTIRSTATDLAPTVGAVYGVNTATSSCTNTIGVQGQVSCASGYGVLGQSSGTNGMGVRGLASGTSGYGVLGYATSSSGTNYAVYGQVTSASGYSGYFTGGQGVRVATGKLDIGCYIQADTTTLGDWLSVSCAAGYEITGGGCFAAGSPYWMQASYPFSSTTWRCGGGGGDKYVYAVCCRIT